jgi:HAD superfamily hydrolase (TIGR01509 family)
MKNGLKAVILDIDGTLLWSNSAHAMAFTEAAENLGLDAGYSKILELIGKGADKLIPEAFGVEEDSVLGKKLSRLKSKIFTERFLPHLGPTPGARELLEALKSKGVIRIVATSSERKDAARLLERAGVQDLIDNTTTADDADDSKPDPDILHAALDKIDASPHQTVMVGDTPYDIEAAHRASIRCLAVRCGGWNDQSLSGAAGIYDDPADILTHFGQAFSLTGNSRVTSSSPDRSRTNRRYSKPRLRSSTARKIDEG